MKAKEIGYNFSLRSAKIDIVSEKIAGYLAELELPRREILRLRMSAETILLTWQERFGTDAVVRLSCYSRLGQPTVRLSLEGDPFDPLDRSESMNAWSRSLLSRLETQPLYSYSRNTNIITFKVLRKQVNPFILLLIALGAAIPAGILGSLLPAEFTTAAAQDWLSPLSDTYLSVLEFCGIPMIFLSVALGIIGVGDVNAFERIGRKMVRHNMRLLLIITVAASLLAAPFFRFSFGADHLRIAYNDFYRMVLGWLPTSLLQPFLDANAMQLIIMGLAFGIGLLKLAPLAKHLADLLDDLNNIMLMISEWLTKLIPLFVFITLTSAFWTGSLAEITPMWKPFLVTMLLGVLSLLIMAAQICRKYHVSLGLLLRKVSHTFLIALGTNSCSASIGENYLCCSDALGIDSKVFRFGIPIGTSTFKPVAAVCMLVLVYFVAAQYQVQVSAAWFLMAVLLAAILSIAAPAIPGGVLMFCPMLFSQLGIPVHAVSPLLATDIFFDCFCTAFNQVAVQFALTQEAGMVQLLDEAVLRKGA